MTLRGVGPLEPGTVVIDVGGGSTELITETFRTSMNIGSVRLTERFGIHQGAAAAYIREQLPSLSVERALGVDGTTAELAGLAGSKTVTLATIDETLEWLAVTTEEERRARLILPDRSEVLAAGEADRHDQRPGGRPLRRDSRRSQAADHRRPDQVRHEVEHAAPER